MKKRSYYLIGNNIHRRKVPKCQLTKSFFFLDKILTLLKIAFISPVDSNAVSGEISVKTSLQVRSYKQCLLNNLNLPIFYYMCCLNLCVDILFRVSLQKSTFYFLFQFYFLKFYSHEAFNSRGIECKNTKQFFTRFTCPL